MSKHEDQLREAFETHENLAPDPAAVYARVQELAKTHKWRRRGVQVAGGVALSAGLVAGVVNLPAILPGSPAPAGNTAGVQAGAPLLAPTTAPSTTVDDEAAWKAYFAAGYDYDDAVRLAKLWQSPAQIGDIKAEAGRKLLAGETLPFRPTPNAPDAAETPQTPAEREAEKQREAYFAAGYGWDEAEKLAKLWKLADPSDAKTLGGKKLLAGEKLPVKASPEGVQTALESKRVNAFFEAGYDVDDAAKLADLWKKSTPYEAKVEGGKRLLAGKKLPIQP